MRLDLIAFKPRASIVFTKEEIETMIKCSASHYDGVCIAAGKSGGFLFGIKNRFQITTETRTQVVISGVASPQPDITHWLEWREIDTLLKILEVPPTDYVPIAASLTMALGRTLTSMSNFTDLEWKPRG